MHGVAILLAAAAVAFALARALRVPAIPLLLIAGLALAFTGRLDAETLENALLLGVSFLLFVVGLELDPRRTRAQRSAAIRVGIWQFLVLGMVGYMAAVRLGFSFAPAVYVALALTASSTLVGVRILQRRRQMFEPFGRLVLGSLLLQDALVLMMLPVLIAFGTDTEAALLSLGAILALAAACLAVRRWVAPQLIHVAQDREVILLAALSVLFGFIMTASMLGVPILIGAFLAGVALARFPIDGTVRSVMAPIGDFFAAVFFTALGALVGIPSGAQIVQAAVLVVLVIVVTVPLVTIVAERSGLPAKSAIEAGLLLAQTSEISLVIGLSGMIEGYLESDTFTVIALVTLVTMLLTPFLATDAIARWLIRFHPSRRFVHGEPPSGHLLLLGTGSTGMPLLEDLVLTGAEVVVVDDDPAVIARLEAAGIRAVRGDASDATILAQAGASRARAIMSTIRRPRDNKTLLELAGGKTILVRVFDRDDAEWIAEHGGTPVLYSEATADAFVEWFDEEQEALRDSLAERLAAAGLRPDRVADAG